MISFEIKGYQQFTKASEIHDIFKNSTNLINFIYDEDTLDILKEILVAVSRITCHNDLLESFKYRQCAKALLELFKARLVLDEKIEDRNDLFDQSHEYIQYAGLNSMKMPTIDCAEIYDYFDEKILCHLYQYDYNLTKN